MEAGYKLHEIDQMDIAYFIELRAHKRKEEAGEKELFIEETGLLHFGLKAR
ncbi:hypothetical protein [Mechercharimyces sp. CAU 1602]|uniref:hypothetical protein n=1 Tax=Mechercharimyces sp. CAU 1602 TaxID=2973933 RepID=UPI00216312A5|nr:hypothetical protein [Mechercharimyces sp. CAU 1602]